MRERLLRLDPAQHAAGKLSGSEGALRILQDIYQAGLDASVLSGCTVPDFGFDGCQGEAALALFIGNQYRKRIIHGPGLGGQHRPGCDRQGAARCVVDLKIAQRVLYPGQVMPDHGAVQQDLDVMAQRAVEHASLAVPAHPGDREVVVLPLDAGDLVVAEVGHVQAQQHAVDVTRIGTHDLIYLVPYEERPAAERGVQRVTWFVDLDRPGSVGGPGVVLELAAHHLGRLGPGEEVVYRRVEAGDPLAGLYEFEEVPAIALIFEGEMSGVIEENEIELGQEVRLEGLHLL